MKKFIIRLFVAVLLFGPMFAFFTPALYADVSPLDQISVALLGHMETVLETTTHGKTRAELLATPIQVGRWNDEYIAGADLGVLGNVKPDTLGQAGFNFTAGVHFHLSPLLRSAMPKISPNYPALAALEINPRVSYRFRNRAENVKPGIEVGLGLGWSFPANPKP